MFGSRSSLVGKYLFLASSILFLSKSKTLTKKDEETYLWSQTFTTELTKEELLKTKDNIEKNIAKLEEELRNKDIRKILQQEEERIDNDYEVKKDALKNFNKYWEEAKQQEEDEKAIKKKELKKYVDNYKELKKEYLKKKQQMWLAEKQSYEQQLEHHLKQMEEFKGQL